MALLIILIIVLSAWLVFSAVQFYNLTFRGFAPFISSQPDVIRAVLGELELKPQAVVYELGCGRAGFLRAVEERYPDARLFGIEYDPWPLFIARVQASLCKSRIIFRRENIFRADLTRADAIYCYLNDTMMTKLKDKFARECRPGTLIVSYTFSIPGWTPEKTVSVPNRPNDKIYFYRTVRP